MTDDRPNWEPAVPEPAPPKKKVPTCGMCGSELKRHKELDTPTALAYKCRCNWIEKRPRPLPEKKK